MKALVACEFSGIVRDSLISLDVDAISCDFLPTERSGPHYQGNVLDLLNENWDLIIAHPPCTRLCNSGVRWLHEELLWDELQEAADFFKKFLNAKAKHIAVENPIMHKYAIELIGRKQDFCVQPHWFGDPFSKRTCFWVKNLPKLLRTDRLHPKQIQYAVHNEPPGSNQSRNRSRFYPKFAKAMTRQWVYAIRNNCYMD